MSLSDIAATSLLDQPTQADRSGSGNLPMDFDVLRPSKGGQPDAGSSDAGTFEGLLDQIKQLTEELMQLMGGGSQASTGADPAGDGSGAPAGDGSGAGDASDAMADPSAGGGGSSGGGSSAGPGDPASAGGGMSGASTDLAGLPADLSKELSSMRSGGAGAAADGPAPAASPAGAQAPAAADGTPPQSAAAPALPPPSTSGSGSGDAAGSNGGSTDYVDGAKAGGDNISLTVDNSSSKAKDFAFTNDKNAKFAEADLKPGQSETIVVPKSDPNLQSMRGQTLNADGSMPTNPKLFEGNEGADGKFSADVSANNFAGDYGTTGQADPSKMTVSDGKGLTVGDGTADGAYNYSVQDRQKGNNPMEMAEDSSSAFEIGLDS